MPVRERPREGRDGVALPAEQAADDGRLFVDFAVDVGVGQQAFHGEASEPQPPAKKQTGTGTPPEVSGSRNVRRTAGE